MVLAVNSSIVPKKMWHWHTSQLEQLNVLKSNASSTNGNVCVYHAQTQNKTLRVLGVSALYS